MSENIKDYPLYNIEDDDDPRYDDITSRKKQALCEIMLGSLLIILISAFFIFVMIAISFDRPSIHDIGTAFKMILMPFIIFAAGYYILTAVVPEVLLKPSKKSVESYKNFDLTSKFRLGLEQTYDDYWKTWWSMLSNQQKSSFYKGFNEWNKRKNSFCPYLTDPKYCIKFTAILYFLSCALNQFENYHYDYKSPLGFVWSLLNLNLGWGIFLFFVIDIFCRRPIPKTNHYELEFHRLYKNFIYYGRRKKKEDEARAEAEAKARAEEAWNELKGTLQTPLFMAFGFAVAGITGALAAYRIIDGKTINPIGIAISSVIGFDDVGDVDVGAITNDTPIDYVPILDSSPTSDPMQVGTYTAFAGDIMDTNQQTVGSIECSDEMTTILDANNNPVLKKDALGNVYNGDGAKIGTWTNLGENSIFSTRSRILDDTFQPLGTIEGHESAVGSFQSIIYDNTHQIAGYVVEHDNEVIVLDETRTPISYRGADGTLYDKNHMRIGKATEIGNAVSINVDGILGAPIRLEKNGTDWIFKNNTTI